MACQNRGSSITPPHTVLGGVAARLAVPSNPTVGAVATLQVCHTHTFFAYTISATEYDLYELTDERFLRLGPTIEDMMIHIEATDVSADFRYNIGVQRRFQSGPWSDPVKVFQNDLVAGSPSYSISPPFTDRTAFGVHTRLVLMANVVAGGAAGQRADLSIAAALRFFC